MASSLYTQQPYIITNLCNHQHFTFSSLIYPVTLYIHKLVASSNLYILQSHKSRSIHPATLNTQVQYIQQPYITSDLYIQQPCMAKNLHILQSIHLYFKLLLPTSLRGCKKNELNAPKPTKGIAFTALILQKHPENSPVSIFWGVTKTLDGLRCRERSNSLHAEQLGSRLVSSRCKKNPLELY